VASRQVSALATAGYIRREPDPEDRRAQLVSPTEAGTAALERAHERIVGVFAAALDDWSDEAIESLTSALNRLRADYERAADLPTISTTEKEAA
jgi:DNA-binding MarR family transcriptional regulator